MNAATRHRRSLLRERRRDNRDRRDYAFWNRVLRLHYPYQPCNCYPAP